MPPPPDRSPCASGTFASGPHGSFGRVLQGSTMPPAPAARRSFPPEVAVPLVKIACELPDPLGRSLSQWDGVEVGRQLAAEGVVESISPQTVARVLKNHRLKPWRRPLWRSGDVPRAAAERLAMTLAPPGICRSRHYGLIDSTRNPSTTKPMAR